MMGGLVGMGAGVLLFGRIIKVGHGSGLNIFFGIVVVGLGFGLSSLAVARLTLKLTPKP
jgi:hypothetical protein